MYAKKIDNHEYHPTQWAGFHFMLLKGTTNQSIRC